MSSTFQAGWYFGLKPQTMAGMASISIHSTIQRFFTPYTSIKPVAMRMLYMMATMPNVNEMTSTSVPATSLVMPVPVRAA